MVLAVQVICYSIGMSLIPDKPLVFFPHVAATLGLDEAILLQTLKEVAVHRDNEDSNGFLWTEVPGQTLLELLPFWTAADIQRISDNLRAQGVLLIGATLFDQERPFRYAFNESVSRRPTAIAPALNPALNSAIGQNAAHARSAPSQPSRGINLISQGWQPEPDVLAQLSQYGIPQQFTLEQVPEFVTYWSERAEPRHSWGSKFIKQVLKLWREQEAEQARRHQEIKMDADWQPSPEVLEILLRADINRNFIEDSVPEFILYWRDRGTQSSTWNTQFIQHIRRQWAKYQSALNGTGDNEFRPMTTNWRPDENVYDILAMASIERDFAEQLVPEFILYWQESGQSLNSWNTKFLQYVKRQWAYHNNTSVTRHATQQTPGRAGSTRHRDLVEELSDRSWAG
ncbi:MAG: DnaT-like ssDNA-binding domain-containing protein [Porticoccaceae bacterium]